jgi:hypothetical protein
MTKVLGQELKKMDALDQEGLTEVMLVTADQIEMMMLLKKLAKPSLLILNHITLVKKPSMKALVVPVAIGRNHQEEMVEVLFG